jgi:hypothetical protein
MIFLKMASKKVRQIGGHRRHICGRQFFRRMLRVGTLNLTKETHGYAVSQTWPPESRDDLEETMNTELKSFYRCEFFARPTRSFA